MRYYLHTKVWVREWEPDEDGEDALRKLGIDKEKDGVLIQDDVVLNLFDIRYFYPCNMKKKRDSVFVKLKGNTDLLLALDFDGFNKVFKECIKEHNKG